jgi:hypothetical protein
MRLVGKLLIASSMAVAAFGVASSSASAAIACSDNVCWHTHEAYKYPTDSRVIVHEDNWKWGPQEHFSFKEHEGRGYWRGERWEDF